MATYDTHFYALNEMISGVLGNILTIIVIDRNKHLHNHMTPLLINLAVGKNIFIYHRYLGRYLLI